MAVRRKRAPSAITGKSKAAALKLMAKTTKSAQSAAPAGKADDTRAAVAPEVDRTRSDDPTERRATAESQSDASGSADNPTQQRDYGKEAREAYKDPGPKPNRYKRGKKANYEKDFDL